LEQVVEMRRVETVLFDVLEVEGTQIDFDIIERFCLALVLARWARFCCLSGEAMEASSSAVQPCSWLGIICAHCMQSGWARRLKGPIYFPCSKRPLLGKSGGSGVRNKSAATHCSTARGAFHQHCTIDHQDIAVTTGWAALRLSLLNGE
jgi:hypothetical protein